MYYGACWQPIMGLSCRSVFPRQLKFSPLHPWPHPFHARSLMEQPFSFFYRDQERELAREELAKAAKDPNRFQVRQIGPPCCA